MTAPPVAPRHAARPRVLFLARNLAIGGAERAFLNLVNHAQAVVPEVVLLRARGGWLHELAPHVARHALDAPVLGGRIGPDALEATPAGSSVQLLLEVRRLAALVDATGSSVVSSFLMRSHLVALLTKALLRPRLRVVLNIHEQMTQSAEFLYPRRRDRLAMRLITRHLFRLADRIVVVADALRHDLTENFGLPAASIQTIHNPVDLARICRMASEAIPPDATAGAGVQTICAVGRLVPLKGYDILLRAVAQVRSRLLVRLVMVGDGDARGPLEAQAAALGIADAVVFTGWEGNPWRHLARADVLVLSSRTEAFPSVITEAFALGVPVVAAECSAGVRECADDGRAAVLVPPESPDALAAAIERVLTTPSLRETLQVAGRRVAGRFALDDAVGRYEAMLRDVVEGAS